MIIPAIVVLPLLLWLGFWSRYKGFVYEFDPSGHKFMFISIWATYRTIYYGLTIAGMGLGLLCFIRQVASGLGFMFLASGIYSLFFNLLTTFLYEMYLGVKYDMAGRMQSNYTAPKRALVMSLGISSVLLFVVALVLLSVTLAGY